MFVETLQETRGLDALRKTHSVSASANSSLRPRVSRTAPEWGKETSRVDRGRGGSIDPRGLEPVRVDRRNRDEQVGETQRKSKDSRGRSGQGLCSRTRGVLPPLPQDRAPVRPTVRMPGSPRPSTGTGVLPTRRGSHQRRRPLYGPGRPLCPHNLRG